MVKKTIKKKKNQLINFTIILKKVKSNGKGITYQISNLRKDWDFSRYVKTIMRRIYRARFFKRVNIINRDHVYRMNWSKNQIQFEQIKATPKYINNNNFYVKVKNGMVFVKNKGRFKRNLNQFKKFKKFKFYNNKINNQNLLGKIFNEINNNKNIKNNENSLL